MRYSNRELLGLLYEIRTFLDNYIDVEDGDYGEPHPNRAMQLDTEVTTAIDWLEESQA